MCSIIGYLGADGAAPIMVNALGRMEYRGYDSVGIATKHNEEICLRKGVGRVQEVSQRMHMSQMKGIMGVGHTRWATHGAVNDTNAHPHMSSSGNIAIVHNGTIENYQSLRESLERSGYTFCSETDSEVIANLLQRHYDITKDAKASLLNTVSEINGHYAFIAMISDGSMVAAKHGEPLILGIAQDGLFLSSDVLGFIDHTDQAIYMESGTCVTIQDDNATLMDFGGRRIPRHITTVSKELVDIDKGEHIHHTIKEIEEQPQAVLRAGDSSAQEIKKVSEIIKRTGGVYATGSGTSYNAALMGKHALARFAGTRMEVILSSEMYSEARVLKSGTVMLAISQSGESADVLEAATIAKKAGCVIVGLLNSANSSLARISDMIIHMDCGPEIGVAATKSFCAQYMVMLHIAQEIAEDTGIDVNHISGSISSVICNKDAIRNVAGHIKDTKDIYILGRGPHYPVAVESALKIKELTYIHAEGLAGGEMKHGPLALIDKDSFVMVMNPYDSTYGDMLLGVREVKARGGRIIGVSDRNNPVYDHWISIPQGDEVSYSFAEVTVSQLLAYYTALARESDPDYPRNLAKSVTVR